MDATKRGRIVPKEAKPIAAPKNPPSIKLTTML
jgi:hypothetical protein